MSRAGRILLSVGSSAVIALIILVGASFAGAGSVQAGKSPAGCGPEFVVVTSPNADTGHNSLWGVSALSPTDAWAVGSKGNGQNLIMHWDGAAWTIVPSPAVGNQSVLNSVVAISANDVWAVGSTSGPGLSATLTMHWDGTAWSVVPSPTQGTNGGSSLASVDAVSSNNVWAVGSYTDAFSQNFILHWDGTQWSVISSPNAGSGANVLHAVTTVSANDVWAAGKYWDGSLQQPLILHWNGSAWSVDFSPVLPSTDGRIRALTSVSANDVWALGNTGELMGPTNTLTYHWNGTVWTQVPSPNVGTGSMIWGASSTGPNDVWAVGLAFQSPSNPALALHWTGSAWNVVQSAAVSGSGFRAAASISPNSVWAVGSYPSSNINRTLVELATDPCATSTPTRTGTPPTATRTPSGTNTRTPTNTRTSTWTATPTVTGTPPTATNTVMPSCTRPPTGTPPPFYSATPYVPCAPGPWTALFDDFENGTLGNFVSSTVLTPTGGWEPQVQYVTCAGPEYAAQAPDPDSVSDQRLTTSNAISIPGDSLSAQLAFQHSYQFEQRGGAYYDGGVLEFSTNSGATWFDAGSYIVSGGYNGTITRTGETCNGITPPFANGQSAWVGSQSLRNVTVSLLPFAGEDLLFRFRLGTDCTGGSGGWTIDNVRVSGMYPNPPCLSTPTPSVGTPVTNTPLATSTPTATTTPTMTGTVSITPTICLPTSTGTVPPFHSPTPYVPCVPGPWNGLMEGFNTGTLGQFFSSTMITTTGGWEPEVQYANCLGTEYAAHAPDPDGISDQRLTLTNALYVPYEITSATLVFDHHFEFEQRGGAYYDGGVLEFSTNNGNTWIDAGSRFISGGYNGTITRTGESCNGLFPPFSNGQGAWVGTGSYRTTVNLMSFRGQMLRFRFRLGTDCVGGSGGWTVDNIIVSGTQPNPPCYTPTPATMGPGTSTATNTPTMTFTLTPTASVTPTQCPIQFSDVPDTHTFYTYIRCLACRNIVGGYGDGTFRPGENVTRGQISKIVALAAGWNEPVSGQTFEDVAEGSTFWSYIERLVEHEVMQGYPCGNPEPCVEPGNRPYFRPGNNATRAQLIKIVMLAAGWQDPLPETNTFQDVPQGSTFWEYVEIAYHYSVIPVIQGYPCGGAGEPCVGPENRPYFRPSSPVTRGQAAKIVANTFYPYCASP